MEEVTENPSSIAAPYFLSVAVRYQLLQAPLALTFISDAMHP